MRAIELVEEVGRVTEPMQPTGPDRPVAPGLDELLAAVRAGCPSRPRTPAESARGWDCGGLLAVEGEPACPAVVALDWASQAAMPAQTGAVHALIDTADPALLCGAALERLLGAHTRLAARLGASSAAAMVALHTHCAAPVLTLAGLPAAQRVVVGDAGKESIAAACRLSPLSAGNRLADAQQLCSAPLDPLRDQLLAGLTTTGHAFLLRQETATLPAALATAVVAHPLVQASLRTDTPGDTAAIVRRLAAELDPDHHTDTEQHDEHSRDARVHTGRDGRHSIVAPTTRLDAEAAQAAFEQALTNARARGDTRTAAQIRHDLLLDPIWQALGLAGRPDTLDLDLDDTAEAGEAEAEEAGAAGDPAAAAPADDMANGAGADGAGADGAGADGAAADGPVVDPRDPAGHPETALAPASAAGPAPAPVLLGLTISLAALLGLAETPALLDRTGAVTAELGRWLGMQARRVRLLVHDHDGRLVYATPDYRFTRPAARTARQAHLARCSYPGCRRDALDLDHAVPYTAGGETSLDNAVPACRRHHNLKTHHRWTTALDPDTGTITWTSPGLTSRATAPHRWTAEEPLPAEERCRWPAPPPQPDPDPPGKSSGCAPPDPGPDPGPYRDDPPCPF